MSISPERLAEIPEVLVVSLARTGERDAFADLVRRREAWIRNLMRRCAGDTVLGDDLAQQAFLQAMQDIRKLRNPRKFEFWLKKLAINVWRGHLRKNDPLRGAAEHGEDDRGAEANVSTGMDLTRALAALPDDVRLCIVLSASEGMSHREIKDATGFPLGTIKSHIRRGRQALRKALTDYRSEIQLEGNS